MNESPYQLIRFDIYGVLRREILSCVVPPGAEIRDADIAERFSVSRSPVRDALLRLEAEGLVVISPRKSYRASPISISDARDLFEFRAVIEPACAANVATEASDEALHMLDLFRSMRSYAMEASASPSFVHYNREFHLTIARLCSNQRVRMATTDLIEQFDRLVTVSISSNQAGGERDALIAEHCEIIDALQARDGKRAGRILARHAGRARKRVLAALSRSPIVP